MKIKYILLIILLTILTNNLNAAKTLYLSYSNFPNNVYKNQKFEVTIKALIATDAFTNLNSNFLDHENIEILNPSNPWTKISDDTYENKFLFKILSKNFKLPRIEVKLYNEGNLIDSSNLNPKNIPFSELGNNNPRFSEVIADSIVLKAYKTKQYNNNFSLTIIDLDGINSNFENFNLKNIDEQGVSSLKEVDNLQNLVYFFVAPIQQKKLTFTYYNSSLNNFKEIEIPLILQNELISTQTDLNPNNSNFEKYKKIAIVILFFLLLIIYIFKRNKILLVLTIISLIVAIKYNLPKEKGFVSSNSFIYILPTKNSTVFFKTKEKEEIEVLEKKDLFLKVLGLKSGFIGWIKEENFEKN